jgi:hypothetical protein
MMEQLSHKSPEFMPEEVYVSIETVPDDSPNFFKVIIRCDSQSKIVSEKSPLICNASHVI